MEEEYFNTEEDIKHSFEFGEEAYDSGIRHPLVDERFSEFLFSEDRQEIQELLDAWYRGWRSCETECGRYVNEENYQKATLNDYVETHVTGSAAGDWVVAIFGFGAMGFMFYIVSFVVLSFFGIKI